MITLISSKKLGGCDNMRHPVVFVMIPINGVPLVQTHSSYISLIDCSQLDFKENLTLLSSWVGKWQVFSSVNVLKSVSIFKWTIEIHRSKHSCLYEILRPCHRSKGHYSQDFCFILVVVFHSSWDACFRLLCLFGL